MTQELKDKWVAALRSGKYQQGTIHLQHDNRFCCLGVLCEVAEVPCEVVNGIAFYSGANASLLPYDMEMVCGRDMQEQLAIFNDVYKLTFPQIAAWIDANVEVEE